MAAPKRILLLSYYFAPDFCAGAFRMEALVRALVERGGEDTQIHVITAEPNRYGGVSAQEDFSDLSLGARVTVHRLPVGAWLPVKGAQALSFVRFAWAARRLALGLRPDLVVATTSRLMTGRLGAHIARRLGVPFHLDLRDLFPDSVKHLLSGPLAKAALPVLQRMQARTVLAARTVSVTSPLYARYLQRAFGHGRVLFVPNGVDRLFRDHQFVDRFPKPPHETLRVLYAGNVGQGQGLHKVLPALAAATRGRCVWRVVGAGGALDALRRELDKAGVDNVELIGPVPRLKLLEQYDWADILFLHVSDSRSTRRVVPSKVFEYVASGKPLLAGIAGFSRRFLDENVSGMQFFPPGDTHAAVALLRHPAVNLLRPAFRSNFNRCRLMTELAEFIFDPLPRDSRADRRGPKKEKKHRRAEVELV